MARRFLRFLYFLCFLTLLYLIQMYLLADLPKAQEALWEMIDRGALRNSELEKGREKTPPSG